MALGLYVLVVGRFRATFTGLASYFILLSQKKVTKEKATPCRLFPALLALMGGNRKLAYVQTADYRNLPLRLRYSARQQGELLFEGKLLREGNISNIHCTFAI